MIVRSYLTWIALSALACTVGACSPAAPTAESRTPRRVVPPPPARVNSPTAARASSRSRSGDGGLRAAARNLLRARGLEREALRIRVDQGVVTVHGKVETLRERQRVVALLGHLRGVTAIRDRLRLPTEKVPDRTLRRNVRRALAAEPAVAQSRLTITNRGGLVTLRGEVDSRVARKLAENAAARIRGVTEIRNELTLRRWKRRTDARLETEVEAALRREARIREGLIEVAVKNGRVTLSGYVGSLAERHRALETSWIRGVRAVHAPGLTVAPSFNPPRARRPPRKPTDAELQQTLRAALDAGAAVEDERITVAVVGGVATLKGSVPTLAARRRVRRVAENTVGVTEVRDQIRVKPPNAVSDKELVERTRAALAQAPRLSALELQVAASAGVVSLVGTVPRHGLRVRVERAVSRIPGVKAIASRLRVPPPETPRRDVSIRRTLRRTLRWSARLDEERIRFQVRRGKVRLEGSVDSIGQRNELTRIARGAGAVEVENRLAIGLP